MTDGTARVLIVDDELHILAVLPQLVRQRFPSATVDACDTAEEAIRRVIATDYDAIVTDVRMPGIDGFTLLHEIRSIRPGTPTLLVTGSGDHDLLVRALRGGAFDFMQKPLDTGYFIESLERAVRMRETGRQAEQKQLAVEKRAADLQRDVEARTRDLVEANRIKDEFIATLSHELRTPLTAILGWIRLLRGAELDLATQASALESIDRNATIQAHLIDDLLDISRIISGKIHLRLSRVELGGVVEAAIDAVASAAAAKGIRLEPCLGPGVGLVSADPSRLEQVLWNLLANAIKFSPRDSRVKVDVGLAGTDVVLTVRDEGAGIRPDFLPHAFDRFRQEDSSMSRSRGGLGLGLAIVKHLVELHGGTVLARNNSPDKGTTFTVTLPDAGGGAAEPAAPAFREVRDPRPTGNALEGLRVLVVEDEPDTERFIRVVLERSGAEVTAVATVALALEAYDASLPDVLLCDIGLPREDGYSLIRQIRSRERECGHRVPAAALTAFARAEDRRRALTEGYQAHVTKPIAPAALVALVENLAAEAAGEVAT